MDLDVFSNFLLLISEDSCTIICNVLTKGLYHDSHNHDRHRVYCDGHSNENVKN